MHTSLPAPPLDAASAITALSASTRSLDDLATLPAASGLYAWWEAPEVLPQLPGVRSDLVGMRTRGDRTVPGGTIGHDSSAVY